MLWFFRRFNRFNRAKRRGARLAWQWLKLSFTIEQLDGVARLQFDSVLDGVGASIADQDEAPQPQQQHFDRN